MNWEEGGRSEVPRNQKKKKKPESENVRLSQDWGKEKGARGGGERENITSRGQKNT